MSSLPVIVSGFAPFGDREVNGSYQFALAIHEQFPETTLLEVPVLWGEPRKVIEAIMPSQPSLWLACGEAPTDYFRLETRARNRRQSQPDNHGHIPGQDLIDEAGPGILKARFPAAKLAQSMRGQGYPCRVSVNAGAYLCEELYYGLLRAQEMRPEMEILFLHVPHFGRDVSIGGVARPFKDEALKLAAWDLFTAIKGIIP